MKNNPRSKRPVKSEDYIALQAKWYKKLKDTGFNDIEQDEEHLKTWTSTLFAKQNVDVMQAKEEYYRMAGQFLHEHKFQSGEDKLIWGLHVGGTSIRDIVVTMRKKGFKVHKNSVHASINRLAAIMSGKCYE